MTSINAKTRSAMEMLLPLLILYSTVKGDDSLQGCLGPFDLVILLDSSISLRDYDPYDRPLQTWKTMTSFAKSFVANLPTDKGIRVAAVRYSSTSEVMQEMTPRQSYSGDALGDLQFVGKNTNTAAALDEAAKILQGSTSSRRIVLLMSDGLTTINAGSTLGKATALKDNGVEIYCVGIGKYIDSRGLAGIASLPESKYFLQLKGQGLADIIRDIVVRRVCGLPDPTSPPPRPCTSIQHCNVCLADSRICEDCNDGYYRNGWTCEPCSANCVECESSNGCSVCDVGYYVDPHTGQCRACSTGIFDLAFLIDSSGSIRDKNPNETDSSGRPIYDNYQIILEFVQEMIDSLPVGRDKTRVAMIYFSDDARVFFRLNSLNYDRDTIRRAVGNTPYLGSFTNISGAFRVLRQDIYTQANGDRPDVPNVCILVTDGESTRDQARTVPDANEVKAIGTRVFAVGATSEINRNELMQVASEPSTSHFFYSNDFRGIKENVLQQLSNILCSM